MNQTTIQSKSTARIAWKRFLHWVRRGHLYFGLLLFPWAILYGVTAYLFNHPTHFPDQEMVRFGKAPILGTPMENGIDPKKLASSVVDWINRNAPEQSSYSLDGASPKFASEFVFGRVDRKPQSIQFLMNVTGSGGTIRYQEVVDKVEPVPVPFAFPPQVKKVEASEAVRANEVESAAANNAQVEKSPGILDSISSDLRLDQRVIEAMPSILDRLDIDDEGLPVVVTSVPDLVFTIVGPDNVPWQARFNVLKGTLDGVPMAQVETKKMTWRQLLLRMHLVHGFPDQWNARWWWAVIVDVMAAVMVGWGVSGLLMWWQIKGTRRWGMVAVGVSLVVAAFSAWGVASLIMSS